MTMMMKAGFYADPEGTPGQMRYWDGSQWTSTTQMAPLPTKPPRRLLKSGEPVWYLVGVIIFLVVVLVGAGLIIGFSSYNSRDVGSTCLTTDAASWSLTFQGSDQYTYTGTVTNTCRYDLKDVRVTAVGYNASQVAGTPTTAYLNYVNANGSFKVSCQLQGQVATAEISQMKATRN